MGCSPGKDLQSAPEGTHILTSSHQNILQGTMVLYFESFAKMFWPLSKSTLKYLMNNKYIMNRVISSLEQETIFLCFHSLLLFLLLHLFPT